MRLFGLIGYPLSHSFSKKYFTRRFKEWGLDDHVYELFAIEQMELFPSLMKTWPDLAGLNVTIPYKQKVIEYLDDIDESAADIGAVNTIKIENGKLIGYNTDVYGFEASLKPILKEGQEYKALVLGYGGAAKGVVWVLEKMNLSFQIVSRQVADAFLSYDQVDENIIKDHRLIINTTPLGMSPNEDSCPALPFDALTSTHILYDLVYNPEITRFLQHGLDHNSIVKNGLEMLHLQADRAWEIWNQ